MKHGILKYCAARRLEYARILDARKEILLNFSAYLRYKKGEEVNVLIYQDKQNLIGHLIQIWSIIAAEITNYPNFDALSTGDFAIEVDGYMINLMLQIGFDIHCKGEDEMANYLFVSGGLKPLKIEPKCLGQLNNLPGSMACVLQKQVVIPQNLSFEWTEEIQYTTILWEEGSPRQIEAYHKLIGQVAREMMFVFDNVQPI